MASKPGPIQRYREERDGSGTEFPLWARIAQEHHDLLTAFAKANCGDVDHRMIHAMCKSFIGEEVDVGRPVTAHERVAELEKENTALKAANAEKALTIESLSVDLDSYVKKLDERRKACEVVEQVPASEPYPTNVVKVWQSKTTRWWLFDDGSVQCASIGSNAWFRANTTLAQLEACRCDTGDPVKLIYARESKPSEPPARTVEQEAEKWAEKVIAPNKLYDGAISFWDTTLPNGIPMNCGNFADTRLPNRLRSAMVRILTAFATTHATELQAKLSKANERVEAQARVIEEAQARVIEAWEDLHRKGHMEWNTCWAILGDAKSQLSKLEGT